MEVRSISMLDECSEHRISFFFSVQIQQNSKEKKQHRMLQKLHVNHGICRISCVFSGRVGKILKIFAEFGSDFDPDQFKISFFDLKNVNPMSVS